MDIQKENNLIQEAFEVEADEIGFCLDQKWGDYENPYENSDTALAFNLFKKGWQAKSQGIAEKIALIIRDVAELPDRTSPEDWPEALIVTSGELEEILTQHLSEKCRNQEQGE